MITQGTERNKICSAQQHKPHAIRNALWTRSNCGVTKLTKNTKSEKSKRNSVINQKMPSLKEASVGAEEYTWLGKDAARYKNFNQKNEKHHTVKIKKRYLLGGSGVAFLYDPESELAVPSMSIAKTVSEQQVKENNRGLQL